MSALSGTPDFRATAIGLLHLLSRRLPDITLPSTSGGEVRLRALGRVAVLFIYPMTGRPDVPLPAGWDDVPGARGCTAEACGFRDELTEFAAAGVSVYGLSSQTPDDQAEAAKRLALGFELLADRNLDLAGMLGLPTFTLNGRRFYERQTLVSVEGRVAQAFYPVRDPAGHAAEVLEWLRMRTREM